MADVLRDRIAAIVADARDMNPLDTHQVVDAILMQVRAHATSDAAVKAALKRYYSSDGKFVARSPTEDMRAAILAALGGSDG